MTTIDLSPFRTIVALDNQVPLVLETRLLNFTREIYSAWDGEGDLGLSCSSTGWEENVEVVQWSLKFIDFAWDDLEQPARWDDRGEVTVAPDLVLPPIGRRTFTLNEAASDITYTHFQAANTARIEALADRLNATDVLNATLTARFGAVEDLMREMRNDLREISGRRPP